MDYILKEGWNMQIREVRVIPIDIPFKKAFKIAKGTAEVARHVLVLIRDKEGMVGFGEASTMTSYTSEFQEGVIKAVNEYFVPLILNKDTEDILKLRESFDTVLHDNTYAKAAVEIALFDLLAKEREIPVYKLLGPLRRKEVPVLIAIGQGDLDSMVKEAEELVDAGFTTVKVKIGGEPKDDLQKIKAIRNAIGDQISLRVDANQGYRRPQALSVLPLMEEFGIELVEQPLSRNDMKGAAELARKLQTPIMADESAYNASDVFELASVGAASIINIKIMKPGGLIGSLQMSEVADAADLTCIVGSMPEFGVGTAAGIHFAAVAKNIELACELAGPCMLTGEDIIEEDIRPVNGVVKLPSGPGLGITLKKEYLDG